MAHERTRIRTFDEAALMTRPTAELSRLGSRVDGHRASSASWPSAAGYVAAGDRFWQSYLIGYIFWIGITLGSLGILMIQHLTGGAWTMISRRLLEAATRKLPLMALLFLPIWFNLAKLYPWVSPSPDDEKMQEVLHLKGAYLNSRFFGVSRGAVLRDLGRSRLLPEQVVAAAG